MLMAQTTDDGCIVCGVYKITCVPTTRIYIGSSLDIRYRWSQHRAALRGQKHCNGRLQKAWDEHGETAFAFDVIEETPECDRILREQFHLDTTLCYHPNKGFNICEIAGAHMGVPGKRFFVTFPDGTEQDIRNLKAFCRQHRLRETYMYMAANGRLGQVRGFLCRYAHVTAAEQESLAKQRDAVRRGSLVRLVAGSDPLPVLLRSLRAGRGLTQTELADLAGLPQSTLAGFETGKRGTPTAGALLKLSAALAVQVDLLVRAAAVAEISTKKPD